MTDLAVLRIVVDAAGAIRAVDQFGNSVDGASKKAQALVSAAKVAGAVIGTTLFAALRLVIKETAEAQREQAQLAAALRSTAQASGQTIDSLNAHADALRRVTAATDSEIAGAQGLLLTFTKIGGDTFPRATKAVLDMAQALGTDARGAALQLGKALNDPIAGITALSRAGVQFSDQQKEVIKGFVETNQLAKAQNVILSELETQVGGSAEAYRNTLGGALRALKESFVELFEASGKSAGNFTRLINGAVNALEALQSVRERMAQWEDGLRGRGGSSAGITSFITENVAKDTPVGPRTTAAAMAAEAQRIKDAAAAWEQFWKEYEASANAADAFQRERADRALGDAEAQDAAVRALEDQHYKDSAEAFAFRMDQERQGLSHLTEAARVFEEQTQIALARFASDFLRDGFSSIGAFWDDFKQLGRDALGNLFARIVMEQVTASGIGARVTGALGTAGTAGLGFIGLLASSLNAASARARQLAEAFAAVQRSIKDFAAQATDTPAQAARRQLENNRDNLARQAVAATGISGFTGGLSEAQQAAAVFLRVTGNAKYRELATALRELEAAFNANVAAAEAATRAAEEQARANQRVALTQFRDSLSLSAQSPLSPTAQLAEARRQYDAILGLARVGDASAIDSLPETARTLLDASRAVFASGARYADEFSRVTADVNAIIASLAPTEDIQQAQLTVQQEGFTGMIDRMDTLIERIESVDRTLRTGVVVEEPL